MSVNFTITNANGGTSSIQNTNTSTVYRYQNLSWLDEGATGANQLTTSRPGVLTAGALTAEMPNALAVSASGSGLVANIAPGAAVVERTTPAGPYTVQLRAVGAVTLTAAHATLGRVDRIDLQVFDGALGDNGGVSLTRLVVTDGTASASPVAAAAPSNSIPLATVLLPAATTLLTSGMLTDVRKSAGVRGGVRMLLPGDALADVGFMSGELRDTSAKVGVSGIRTIDRWNASSAVWQTLNIAGNQSPGLARYYRSSTSDLTMASGDPIPFDTAQFTTPLIVASGSGNTLFTVQKAGTYMITTSVKQGSTLTSQPIMYIDLSGTIVAATGSGGTTSFLPLSTSTLYYIAAGGVVSVRTLGQTIQGFNTYTHVAIQFISS